MGETSAQRYNRRLDELWENARKLGDKHSTNFDNKKKKVIRDFEDMREMAELKALSKASLERHLSEREAERMIELGRKRGLITKVV